MTMPAQKRGKSEQTVRTPVEFIMAVERMFGPLDYDLAALQLNAVAPEYYGPDHEAEEGRDSLKARWPIAGLCWCNPPFANIAPWAAKCAEHSTLSQAHVLLLVPASIGANWYRDYVTPYADVYSIGRLVFQGHTNPTPKDLVLCHYWPLGGRKFRHWSWRTK